MLKVTVAVLAVALAGTASAAGWRKLQIHASSEAAFQDSVATFEQKLSPSRRVAFTKSLEDIKREGTQRATAEQREYTTADYLRELDGLGYEEVVRLTDPTGGKAASYRRNYYARATGASSARYASGSSPSPWASPTGGPPPVENGVYRGATRSIDHQTH
jgi:hypothetical protein